MLAERNITFAVSRADRPFREWLERYDLMELTDPGRFYPTNRHAAAAFRAEGAGASSAEYGQDEVCGRVRGRETRPVPFAGRFLLSIARREEGADVNAADEVPPCGCAVGGLCAIGTPYIDKEHS